MPVARTSSSPALHELAPAVVCGLIHERGEAARTASHEADSERDHATWQAVRKALDDARQGARPAYLADQPPRWLFRLVRNRLAELAERYSRNNEFDAIRALERLGLVDLDIDDTYVLAVVSAYGTRSTPSPADYLRADPELRENVVWRLFEVEGGGEVSLANVDKYSSDETGTWKQAFLDLTADGTLPRARVLTAALDALNLDFSAYRAGWYGRLYDALAPTTEEQAAHQARFRRLLRSEIAATVKLAVSRLQFLSKAGLLDDAATVPAVAPALLAPVKGTAVAAVRLLGDIADRTPSLGGQVADSAATALGHPHADVQKAAVKLLSRLGAADVVTAAAGHLEPSVRAALGHPVHVHESAAPMTAPAAPPPALRPAEPADVLDRFAALLEDSSDPVELELVLAGLAAADNPEVLRPLLKRARNVLSRGPRETVIPGWLRGHLARLVLRSVGEHPTALPVHGHSIGFLVRRLDEVAAVLAGDAPPRRLLATPNDPAGWVQPAAVVERIAASTRPPGRYDLVAALLRLHPYGRPAALIAATALAGRLPDGMLAAVRYALGDHPVAGGSVADADTAWWVAASRARTPLVDDDWLQGRNIRGAGRSRALSPRLDLVAEAGQRTDGRGVSHRWLSWLWSVEVEDPAPVLPDDEPTATSGHGQRGRGVEDSWYDVEDFVGWQALLWPHDAERFLIDAVHPVLETATTHEVRHDAVRVLDALYRHPGRLGALAAVTLAAGLTAARADGRARAVDAVLHFNNTGRLTGTQLARGLADLAGPGTPTRWAASLKDVSAAGPAGRHLVIEALGTALPEFDPATRGLHALLELLREELLRQQAPTPASLRPWLAQFSGSSRTATVAQALLTDAAGAGSSEPAPVC